MSGAARTTVGNERDGSRPVTGPHTSSPAERNVERIACIRELADTTLQTLKFNPTSLSNLPAHMRMYQNPELKCAAILVDSMTGLSQNGQGCVASAGFVSIGRELWPVIVITAPSLQTVRGSLPAGVSSDFVSPEMGRLLRNSSEVAVMEAIAHEFVHVTDMVSGRLHARILQQASLFDLCQAQQLPQEFAPQKRPSKDLERACRLLSEIAAYSAQPVSEPDLFRAAVKCTAEIKLALNESKGEDLQYRIWTALGEWGNALPQSYDVGGNESLALAMSIVIKDQAFR